MVKRTIETRPAPEGAPRKGMARRGLGAGALLAAALLAGPAVADEARIAEGLSEGCLTLGVAPLFIPDRMNQKYYWSVTQRPSSHDFRIIRDDTRILLDARAPGKSCLVTDLRAQPTAEIVEAALEAKFPGGWTRVGDAWAVAGDAPLTVKLTTTEDGAAIAVETGS